ncbi:uncharacterized protein LOC129286752 [Prosopis cineraria]|uniref:uncharacterized protein LOC129286752 n=1 Tax=Prosopis cineraria TaxID=364024 RepID=UPI00240F50F1|nr:uncharacterized protein LOC129286752 [Prosopis cineraria]
MGRSRVTRFLPSNHQESGGGGGCSGSASLDDVEFEFLGDGGDSLAAAASRDERWDSNEMELDEDDDDDVDKKGFEHNKSFWDDQHQLLQATLCRSSSVESRIRNATKEALKEIQSLEPPCGCEDHHKAANVFSICKKCSLRRLSSRLHSYGFNTAICKTKWRTSPPDIPSGEHNFMDVVDSTSSRKGEPIRVIVELNFRPEFEMAKASQEYNRLVRQLPEVFVGKVERLRTLIKIMCMAAKRCMKENKMHMGPWRKQRYMQSKWLGPCERNTSTASFSMFYSDNERMMPKTKVKPMASMLTIDLLEKLPNLHCTMVEVS